MKNAIFILPIEPIEQRYTAEWFKHIPLQLRAYIKEEQLDFEVITVKGRAVPNVVPPGQFLDFAATNIYKSTQMADMAKRIQAGDVRDGDVILVTDAWNPAVLQLRYMIDLLGLDVTIHGLWHAGSYDPTDILGIRIKDKSWSIATERAMALAYHKNYFASDFHRVMFSRAVLQDGDRPFERCMVVGWPMEYLRDEKVYPVNKTAVKNVVLFPHRLSSDKQPEIFLDLVPVFRDMGYECVVTQNHKYSKEEYHKILDRTKYVFSCSLHENLGISMYEAMLHGAIPIVPGRASYSEMYFEKFKYPKTYTESWTKYMTNRARFVAKLQSMDLLSGSNSLESARVLQVSALRKFFDGAALYSNLLNTVIY